MGGSGFRLSAFRSAKTEVRVGDVVGDEKEKDSGEAPKSLILLGSGGRI
jgi:hypothetical protein